MLDESSSPVLRRRSLCVPEVSQTGVLPHLVLCLPQMVGLGSSHVEDMTLIHRAFTWHSDTVLCNTSALLKEEQRPKRNTGNINSILRLSECDTAIFSQPCGVQFALRRRVAGAFVVLFCLAA